MPGKATPGVFNTKNPNKGGQVKPNFAALAKKTIADKAEQRRIDIANKSRSANPNPGAERGVTPPKKAGPGGRPSGRIGLPFLGSVVNKKPMAPQ